MTKYVQSREWCLEDCCFKDPKIANDLLNEIAAEVQAMVRYMDNSDSARFEFRLISDKYCAPRGTKGFFELSK